MYTALPAPDRALALQDGHVLHNSTRTRMSTDCADERAATLTVSTTRLEMRAIGGMLEVRFSAHRVDRLQMRAPAARPRARQRMA